MRVGFPFHIGLISVEVSFDRGFLLPFCQMYQIISGIHKVVGNPFVSPCFHSASTFAMVLRNHRKTVEVWPATRQMRERNDIDYMDKYLLRNIFYDCGSCIQVTKYDGQRFVFFLLPFLGGCVFEMNRFIVYVLEFTEKMEVTIWVQH